MRALKGVVLLSEKLQLVEKPASNRISVNKNLVFAHQLLVDITWVDVFQRVYKLFVFPDKVVVGVVIKQKLVNIRLVELDYLQPVASKR